MKKFTKIPLVVCVIIICFVAVQAKLTNVDELPTEDTDQPVLKETADTQTIVAVTEIVHGQLLENAILNIEVTPANTKQHVVLHLQSNEFINENTLLKNSYNILQQIKKIEEVSNFTFRWYMLVKNKNTEVLKLTFTCTTIDQLPTITYKDLVHLASSYEKHETLH